ncbi:MAG: hypothetical protein JXA07_04615 [Spirochaetes bacterium]|nr:hypothetical protein [Spirochaetota bacterium]
MNKVAKKIIADAEARAAEIRQKGFDNERTMREEHNRNRILIKERQENECKSLYVAELNRLLARHRLDQGKRLLEAKGEMIGILRERVKETILGDRNRYAGFLVEMVLRGVVSGNEEMLVGIEDRDIVDEAFIQRLNGKVRERTGHESAIRLSGESLEKRGGLVLREERQSFNATIDAVIARLLDDHIVDIARMLFGGGEGNEAP